MEDFLKSVEHLLHLHSCEEEGLTNGKPTAVQWREAVGKCREELEFFNPSGGELEKFIYWDCEDVADFIRDHGSSKKHPDGSETLFLHFPITVHKDGSITSEHRVIN